jgi:hypothetical protein
MNDQYQTMEHDLKIAPQAVAHLEQQLRFHRSRCSHDWDNPNGVYTPDVTPAYRAQGQSHIGAEWPMVDVPRQEVPKWTRTCKTCGHVVTTTERTTETKFVPKW